MSGKLSGRIVDVNMNSAGGLEGVVAEVILSPQAVGQKTGTVGLQTGEGYETADGDIPQDRKEGFTVRASGLPHRVEFHSVDAPTGAGQNLKLTFMGDVIATATREELEALANTPWTPQESEEVEAIRESVNELWDTVDELQRQGTGSTGGSSEEDEGGQPEVVQPGNVGITDILDLFR